MAAELTAMVERHEHLGWVNALGLMIGIELVANPGTTIGSPSCGMRSRLECYRRGYPRARRRARRRSASRRP
jgi:4-aminobutyrate aminotransferase-like enzyme